MRQCWACVPLFTCIRTSFFNSSCVKDRRVSQQVRSQHLNSPHSMHALTIITNNPYLVIYIYSLHPKVITLSRRLLRTYFALHLFAREGKARFATSPFTASLSLALCACAAVDNPNFLTHLPLKQLTQEFNPRFTAGSFTASLNSPQSKHAVTMITNNPYLVIYVLVREYSHTSIQTILTYVPRSSTVRV